VKIISKFKDYYDGVGSLYQDKTPLYLRHTREVKKKGITKHYNSVRVDKQDYSYRCEVIGFCGKIYLYTIVTADDIYMDKVFYDYEELDKILQLGKSQRWNRYWGKPKSLKKIYESYAKSEDFLSIFKEHNVPCFATYTKNGERDLVLNPCLKDYEFFRCIDPHTAYQEIDMYIGNFLLNTEDPDMPVGSDVVVAQSKGFDKFSFRQDKGSKKRKQK